jgi:hypothetical protein
VCHILGWHNTTHRDHRAGGELVLLLRALLSDRYVLAGLTMIALGSSLYVAALLTWGA